VLDFYGGLETRREEIEKIPPTDKAVPTLFKQKQQKYFFDRGIGFVSISSVKVFIPTCMS
jgi:hypothetical protein